MRSLVCFALIAGLAATGAAAATAKKEAAAPAAAAKSGVATWTVDKAASKLGFESSFNGTKFEGSFKTWDAQIAFDPKNLAGSKVTVTVNTASALSGDETRDETIPTEDWFSVVKFPRATFVSTGFKDLGGGKYQATGNLTLKGVTKPTTLNFTLAITGDTAKMTGSASVMRNAFNVGEGQFASAETVPFAVTIPVTLPAKRAK